MSGHDEPRPDRLEVQGPIYSKKPKTSTRSKKKPAKATKSLETIFQPPSPPATAQAPTTAGLSLRFKPPPSLGSIPAGDERVNDEEERGGDAEQRGDVGDEGVDVGEGRAGDEEGCAGDEGGRAGDKEEQSTGGRSSYIDPENLSELEGEKAEEDFERDERERRQPRAGYSNEARVYHARYADLSEQHDKGELHRCREGCLDLLTEPRLPRYTRIQTLQMLSTLLPAGTGLPEDCLKQVSVILSQMDKNKIQVQLLLADNHAMQLDLQTWKVKQAGEGDEQVGEGDEQVGEGDEQVGEGDEQVGVGDEEAGGGRSKASKGAERLASSLVGDDRPSAAYWRFDRDVQEEMRQELAKELEHVGFNPAALRTDQDIKGDVPVASGLQPVASSGPKISYLASPEASDEEN